MPCGRHVACQAPPSMGFSRQEYWSGLPFPPPGDLPDPGVKPTRPVSLYHKRILYCWAIGQALSTHFAFFDHAMQWACGILVLRPGIEPIPPALEVWSLNHWTTREVHRLIYSYTLLITTYVEAKPSSHRSYSSKWWVVEPHPVSTQLPASLSQLHVCTQSSTAPSYPQTAHTWQTAWVNGASLNCVKGTNTALS